MPRRRARQLWSHALPTRDPSDTSGPPESPTSAPIDGETTRRFFDALFGHELLDSLSIGTSAFPPPKGKHVWHATPASATAWAVREAEASNVYFRTTPVRVRPTSGRGAACDAAGLLGFHADIDVAGPAHAKEGLPPDETSAHAVVSRLGLAPTVVVHSGHGLQVHWLLAEPWIFEGEDLDAATELARRFGLTIAACARALGLVVDTVSDLARILRVPGTVNRKGEPVSVRILSSGGPRYTIGDIENVLVDPVLENIDDDVKDAGENSPFEAPAAGAVGFDGPDEALLEAARRAKNGPAFRALFDAGLIDGFGNDRSLADWHLVAKLGFWCGPDTARIDRLFRRSKLMRAKWDEVHSAEGKSYGEMTIADVLSRQKTFFRPRPKLPVVVVSNRQLRDQSEDSFAAIRRINDPPVIFQRAGHLIRVRRDTHTGASAIQLLGVDEVVGLLTRSADFVRINNQGGAVATRPPEAVARDILSMPSWDLPTLAGIAESPRVRPDGSLLVRPGYDPATHLVLAEYAGWRDMAVPEAPTPDDLAAALITIGELICNFPFVGRADRANALGYFLTPILRPAISGAIPLAAFDALSKQGTGKTLLMRLGSIVATGRDVPLTAVPNDEAEWRKSLTALLLEGRDVVLFDNAAKTMIESATWANVLTAPEYDDRVLGASKRVRLPVRCTWGISGNAMVFGGDMVRRTYRIMLDAGVERPEDRTGFRHELPSWAFEHRGELLRACLVLCRYWWSNECPRSPVPIWGSYEEWTKTVGGVLHCAGVPDFLGNRQEFREAADVERAEWFGFVSALAEALGVGRVFKTSDVVGAVQTNHDMVERLPTPLREAWDREKDSKFSTKLGRALGRHAGAVFGSYRLASAGRDAHTKAATFRVEEAGR